MTYLKGVPAILLATALGSPAMAQTYPDRQVTIIVPANPGGTGDIVARALGELLAQQWGQTVLVENLPGAGGEIGATALTEKPADGYTMILTTGQLAILPAMADTLPFSMTDDIRLVNVAVRLPYVLGTSGDPAVTSPDTFAELIETARANPGLLTYSSGGVGSASHLVVEQMATALGVEFLHVPYQGSGGEAMVDVMAGRVDFTVSSVPEILGFFQSGEMTPLAAMSAEPLPILPDLETVSQTIDGFAGGNWIGLSVLRGTPDDVVAKLNADIAAAAASETFQTMIAQQYMLPENLSVADADAFFHGEIDRWHTTVDQLGGADALRQ